MLEEGVGLRASVGMGQRTHGAGVCGSGRWVLLEGALCGAWTWGREAEAALWVAAHCLEKTAGIGGEVCVAFAVIGWKLEEEGPETVPQGSPGGAWSEGEACVTVQPAVGEAGWAWAHGEGLVMRKGGLGALRVEPETEVSEEKEAFEDAVLLLIE